jgi:hypothetical protein
VKALRAVAQRGRALAEATPRLETLFLALKEAS